MIYILCYNKPMYAFNPNTKKTKGFKTYLKHWYNNFEKTCGLWSWIIVNFFEEEINKGPFERQPTKK